MFNSGKRKHKCQGKKQAKLEKYYAKYFKRSLKKSAVKEDETQAQSSKVASLTSSEDNTMRGVQSLQNTSSLRGLTPMDNTDRQLADLFPLSDYQRLLSEVEETKAKEQLLLQGSKSLPTLEMTTEIVQKQCHGEPTCHPNITIRKPRKAISLVADRRVDQLEQEIDALKELVTKLGGQLGEAKKEIVRLLDEKVETVSTLDTMNGRDKSVKEIISKFNNETLIPTLPNPHKKRNHYTT